MACVPWRYQIPLAVIVVSSLACLLSRMGVVKWKHQGFWQLLMMDFVLWQELYLSPRLRREAQDADAAETSHKHFTLRCL